MKKNFSPYFLLITCLFLINITLTGQTLEELLNEGDALVAKYNNKAALTVYQKADAQFPNNSEVYWRISRAYVDIGEHMPVNTGVEEDAQFAMYEKALSYADQAVKLDSTKSVNFIRRAIANGRIALFKGVFSVAGVVNQVKADCEKAIKLGNGGAVIQSLSHYILARTHAKISEKWAPARSVLGLGWADLEIALKEYQKAVDLRPNFIMFYLDYAKANIEDDEYDKARSLLNKALASPIQDEDDNAKLDETKKLLKEIEDE